MPASEDGSTNNRSWNCGAEGPTEDSEINALRDRQIRNILGTLLLAQGTPMLLAGDEFARTQNGNNNAYCQDNEISWVNWDVNEKGQFLIHFAQHLTRLRHRYSILRRSRFLTGEYNEELGIKDVTWINASGVAFYALLANFPGIAALISIYGLFADPASVANHLTRLRT